MRKVIYTYINDEDLSLIIKLLLEKGIIFYDKDKIVTDEVQAITDTNKMFYLSNNCESFIEFIPCFYTLKYLQPASFCIEYERDSVLKEVFLIIKQHIQQRYILSPDKSYYIGASMYRDWLDKKYCYPVLFQYKEFSVDEKNIKMLFNELLKNGYIIRTNKSRLRNRDVIDFSAESFILYVEHSVLITTIIRKSLICYEYGSDCIFVYRKKRKKSYVFQLDKRIADDIDAKAPLLFEKLQKSIWSKQRSDS